MIKLKIKKLIEAAQLAPSADNSQPWHLSADSNSILISYDAVRVQKTTFGPTDPGTLLSIGAVIENITSTAESIGIQVTEEVFSEYTGSQPHYARLHCFDNPAAENISGQIPCFNRHTNRLPYKNKPLPNKLLDLICLQKEGDARINVFNDPAKISSIATLIKQCSEIRFQTQELHEWLAGSLRFDGMEPDDGLDTRTFDLPPGGVMFLKFISNWKKMAFLNHFWGYKLLALVDTRPIQIAPAVVAVISPSDHRSIIDAGRVMERAWIHLNLEDIAVHPFFVVTDQLHRHAHGKVPEKLISQIEKVSNAVPRTFGLGSGETLQILLRIGYPCHSPFRSQRLSLGHIFTDLST